jgi:hypothetical protein
VAAAAAAERARTARRSTAEPASGRYAPAAATVQASRARPAGRALLDELASDQRPLTHEILDQFPPSRPLGRHLRAVLVAADGLPARDERMASLQRWITAVIRWTNRAEANVTRQSRQAGTSTWRST